MFVSNLRGIANFGPVKIPYTMTYFRHYYNFWFKGQYFYGHYELYVVSYHLFHLLPTFSTLPTHMIGRVTWFCNSLLLWSNFG